MGDVLKHAVFAGSACLFAGCATAQEEPPAPQPGPCVAAPYTDFDFWVGDWDVRDAEGTLQGHNTITREENGCLIVERWTSAGGNTGQSYNYYDPGMEAWRQIWVSQGITIDYKGGLEPSGVMVLFGDIAYRNGATYPFMGRWELQANGSVIQHFQQYEPESGDWADWFTGHYTKRTDSEPH